MKHMKFSIVLLIVVLLFVGGLAACFPGETVEAAYSDFDQAAAAGAVERGWIPEWLPKSAVNIREKHNLDSNAGIMRFSQELEFVLPSGCEESSDVPPATLDAEWWPSGRLSEFTTFTCEDGFLATYEADLFVYFWRP